MKLRGFAKNEEGAVAVVVAVGLTLLLGVSALAVDFGMMASCRQSMQNAADAAALAGALDLKDKHSSAVNATVNSYCAVNGFDPSDDDITVVTETTVSTVKVTISREMDMGFSGVLTGKNTRTVSASATAETVSIFGGCPYAMFAARRIEDNGTGIAVYGNDVLRITGNIHSNSDINMDRAILENGSIATAVRNIYPSSSGWYGHSDVRDMPSVEQFDESFESLPRVVKYSGSVIKNGRSCFPEFLQESIQKYRALGGTEAEYKRDGLFIYVPGDLIFNGYNAIDFTLTYPVTLVVEGNVSINGAPMEGTLDFPVCVMSRNGNISISGGKVIFAGIMFAPKGNVEFMGIDVEYLGSIIAQNIVKSGGSLVIRYAKEVARFQPVSRVHLVD